MKKRMISLLLVVCMMLMMLPTTALAEGTYTLTLKGTDNINYFIATTGPPSDTYTLVVTSNKSVDLAAGTVVELNCSEKSRAIFTGWNVEPAGAATIPNNSQTSFIMPAQNISIKPIVESISPNASISANGVLTWNAVSGCTSSARIYGDNGFITSFIMESDKVEANGARYSIDLEAALNDYEANNEKLTSGTYSINLIYYKDGNSVGYVENAITYDYIGQLTKLATPANPHWDSFTAKWNTVANAANYTIALISEIDGSTTAYGLRTVSEPQFNLFDLGVGSLEIGATYRFRVIANPVENSDSYLSSDASEYSAQTAPLLHTIGATVTPDGKVFDTQPKGYTELIPQEFTIENIGTGELSHLQVSLTGADAGSFILDKTSTAAFLHNINNKTTFTAIPKTGLTDGTYEATIEVSADNLTTIKKPISFTVHTHTPEEDDGDCTTPIRCSSCGEIVTPAKTHDFTGNYLYDENNHWHVCANDGCTVTDEKKAHTWVAGTITKAPTYFEDGTQVYNCICGATKNVALPQLIDTEAPTGNISIDTHSWNSFLNAITFGLFFKETQTVSVTADDTGSGVDQTYYYLSDTELSKEEAANLTDWTAFSDCFPIDPNHNYVVYIKITDKVGNSSIINSDGLVLDNIVPQISGVTDGAVYCAAVLVTVSDDNLSDVKVNSEEVTLVNGKFTVNPKDGEQTIVATDKAGNSTTIKITVYDDHLWDEGRVTTPPTAAAEGIKTYTCERCGADRTEPIAKLAPSMTEGQGNTYEQGANGTLIFRSDAAFADFISVSIDGNTLSPDHYNLSDGSIIVELKEEYLKTLAVGIHMLGIHSASGTATAEFAIEEKPTITGPTTMTLIEGYSATATAAYTIEGYPIPKITQDTTHGDKIVWNDATKKLDIDPGLRAGVYPIELTVSNGSEPDAVLTFRLTVEGKDGPDNIPKLGDRSMGGWWLLASLSAMGMILTLAMGRSARRKRNDA